MTPPMHCLEEGGSRSRKFAVLQVDLGIAAELKVTHENVIDHNKVHLNILLDHKLWFTTPPLNLQTSAPHNASSVSVTWTCSSGPSKLQWEAILRNFPVNTF